MQFHATWCVPPMCIARALAQVSMADTVGSRQVIEWQAQHSNSLHTGPGTAMAMQPRVPRHYSPTPCCSVVLPEPLPFCPPAAGCHCCCGGRSVQVTGQSLHTRCRVQGFVCGRSYIMCSRHVSPNRERKKAEGCPSFPYSAFLCLRAWMHVPLHGCMLTVEARRQYVTCTRAGQSHQEKLLQVRVVAGRLPESGAIQAGRQAGRQGPGQSGLPAGQGSGTAGLWCMQLRVRLSYTCSHASSGQHAATTCLCFGSCMP